MLPDPDSNKFTFRKYYNSLNKVNEVQPHTDPNDPQITQDFQLLMKWIQENGGFWKWVKYPVYYINRAGFKYPGMELTHDVECNQDYIYIPYKLFITSGKAWTSELQPFYKKHPQLFKHNAMFEENIILTFIISERSKKESSFWYPMINMFPKEVGLIIFLDDKELDLFEDPQLKKKCLLRQKVVRKNFEMFREAALKEPTVFQESYLTWEMFKWSYEVMHSRCFNNTSNQFTVAPLAEFINHENVHCHYYLSKPKEQYKIDPYNEEEASSGVESDIEGEYFQTDEPHDGEYFKFINDLPLACNDEIRIATYNQKFKAGVQPFITYKHGRNQTLLFSYGFIIENNKHNCYLMSVREIVHDSELPSNNEHILGYNLSGYPYYLPIFMSKFSMKMHCLSLLMTAKEEHNDEYYKSFKSYANELNALQYSMSLCKAKLCAYKTTYDEDDAILSKPMDSYTLYCATVYKKEQKKVLINQIELHEFLIKLLTKLKDGNTKEIALNEIREDSGKSSFDIKLLCRKAKKYLSYLKY